MTLLLFLLSAVLLWIEGWLVAGFFVPRSMKALRCALALPLGAFWNTFVLFDLTVITLPLSALILFCCHAFSILVLFFLHTWMKREPKEVPAPSTDISLHSWKSIVLGLVCAFIIGSAFISSTVHGVLLPTFHYDSATNWIVRSKVSWTEQRLAFDNKPPHELLLKPNYPFLLHGLHLQGNLGQSKWSDRAANAMSFLVSWSAILVMGLLIVRLKNRRTAVLAIGLLLSIPFFAVHMGQGYADHLLALFAGLSLLSFFAQRAWGGRWILLSGTFAAACVWTKTEGLPFVFAPWLVLLAAEWMLHREKRLWLSGIFGMLLAAPWPIFALILGLGLTPHASDASLGFQQGIGAAMVSSFFVAASFGIASYAFLAACFLGIVSLPGAVDGFIHRHLPLLFGGLSLLAVLIVYGLTPNVEYLLNAQSFDRQLLTPAVLLLLALVFSSRLFGEDH